MMPLPRVNKKGGRVSYMIKPRFMSFKPWEATYITHYSTIHGAYFHGEATYITHYSTIHGAYFHGFKEANRLLKQIGFSSIKK
ncbi:LOW QUALITY PROTEIN: hypothetical protein HID58_013006 [Brassica napus]|uniref:Amine oxidase domain-containing protein n=1 Tax=Brassica napus TaxID=3708 RepID=A0ABQ8E2N9_BRANA|nr:LOW QUALITY PROTEIN: hypothetical protein HID58_013006 [Brassica napus]